MYHRVTLPTDTMQAGMFVTPDTFNKHLQFLKKKFAVISLKELLATLKQGKKISSKKPVCVLTFDDGWKDFYDFAFPLLHTHKLPATVFLPTEYIGSSKRFWTDIFADLILQQHKTPLDINIKAEYLETISQLQDLQGSFEEKLEVGIELLKKLPKDQIFEILTTLSKMWGVKNIGNERDFIDWSEANEMLASELISFGSHTVSHEILTTIPENTVKKELIDSKHKLLEKGLMNDSCLSFCYPNGNVNGDISRLVHESGYDIAVTTKNGWNQNDSDMMTLNRVGVHQDMTSNIPLFATRITGII